MNKKNRKFLMCKDHKTVKKANGRKSSASVKIYVAIRHFIGGYLVPLPPYLFAIEDEGGHVGRGEQAGGDILGAGEPAGLGHVAQNVDNIYGSDFVFYIFSHFSPIFF